MIKSTRVGRVSSGTVRNLTTGFSLYTDGVCENQAKEVTFQNVIPSSIEGCIKVAHGTAFRKALLRKTDG